MEKNKKIAIQGINGSFHYEAAFNFYKDEIEIVSCASFEEIAKVLKNNEVDYGVMAIENSIAGTLIPNYAIIDRDDFWVCGEQTITINQHLMALPGQKIEDIEELYSHPIALLQCMEYLKEYPKIKIIEYKDTAGAAQRIKEENLYKVAAIASEKASELFDLEILISQMQTVKNNQTRFVFLASEKQKINKKEVNKASIKFILKDTPGCLATVLNIMNNASLNLTKIQSLPIIETPFTYSFFIDFEFKKYKQYKNTEKVLQLLTQEYKLLGIYRKN
jgi:prephenate dehydratase